MSVCGVQMKQGLDGEGPGKTAGFLEGRLELRDEKEGRRERTLQPELDREGDKGQGTGGRRT